jgi:hypothetical protein
MTDDSAPLGPNGEWTDETISWIFKRQVADLEKTRRHLRTKRGAKPADDNPELLHCINELRAIREISAGIERDLRGDDKK